MLIKLEVLEKIKSGEITLQFRRWRRRTVKAGGTLKTKVMRTPAVPVSVTAPNSSNGSIQ